MASGLRYKPHQATNLVVSEEKSFFSKFAVERDGSNMRTRATRHICGTCIRNFASVDALRHHIVQEHPRLKLPEALERRKEVR